MGCGRGTGLGPARDTLAVLLHDARPALVVGAEALEERLQSRSSAGRVAGQRRVTARVGAGGPPLRAPEDQVDLRRTGRDADSGVATAVRQLEVEGQPRQAERVLR